MKNNKLICCIDFEITNQYEPLEFGCVRINTDGEIIDYWETIFSVQGKPILHNQRFEKKGDKKIEQLWQKIKKMLEDNYIAAHNIGTDRSILLKHFPMMKLEGEIDSLSIYRKLYTGQIDSFSLMTLLQTFKLERQLQKLNWNNHFIPHRALFDAAGCALLLARLLKDDKVRKVFNSSTQKGLF